MSTSEYPNINFGEAAGFKPRTSIARVLLWLLVIVIVILVAATIVWAVWYKSSGVTWGAFIMSGFSYVLRILFWPIRMILQLLGLYGSDGSVANIPPLSLPPPLQPSTVVTKHEVNDCPPCNVDVKCPPCDDGSGEIEPLQLEIGYLKDMVKFVGSIAKRENAINAQYKELYPGFNVLSPHVRKLSHEYNYIKEELRKDKDKWQYFKNYFTALTNIPSTASAVHYDVMLD